jgi:hypothetical protein
MRRTLTAPLIFLLLVSDLPARSNHNWENVKKLKPATPISILLWSGENLRGRLDSVSDTGLWFAIPDRIDPQAISAHMVDRANIRRILCTHEVPNLPDPHRWMVVGALAGGAIGVAGGAISDANQHTQGGWLFGGLAGALGGAMVGEMAAGFVGMGKATSALLHHSKTVYEDAGPRPLQSQ